MSAILDAMYVIYRIAPFGVQRAILFVAILAGLFACVAFVRIVATLCDQALPPRDLPPSFTLNNLQSVSPERERQIREAFDALATQPPRVLPHTRKVEIEVR